jgi:hypothetical protein
MARPSPRETPVMNHVLMSDLLLRLERCALRKRFRIAPFLTALVSLA